MPEQVLIEAMTSRELATRMSAGANTVLIFSGGTEASGPHLALGKHNYRVYRYAAQIADSLGNTLVAPVLPFAPNSPVLERYPGTISLTDETFSDVNEQVVRSMVASGFRYIILMSDHFNSQRPLKKLAARLDSTLRSKGVRVFFSSDGYAKARAQIEAGIARQGLVPVVTVVCGILRKHGLYYQLQYAQDIWQREIQHSWAMVRWMLPVYPEIPVRRHLNKANALASCVCNWLYRKYVNGCHR
ncbi:creatininase family protein [Chitinophaga pinensis]|nr:creatininase family protein [Chitinophaga pinensis]